MAAETKLRFTFDFADLRPRIRDHGLRVLRPAVDSPPPDSVEVDAQPRPDWLPRLLPVFHCEEPLRVVFGSGAASGAVAAAVQEHLAVLLASAGADSGIHVLTWPRGLAVGPRLDHIPKRPHAWVAVAQPSAESLQAARLLLRSAPAGDAWLVLEGFREGLGGLEAGFDLPADRTISLPSMPLGEVRRHALGLVTLDPGPGRAYLDLARRLVGAYARMR